MDAFNLIAEQRIAEAMRRGEFDDLPGSGEPLPPDDAAGAPPELRMAYKVLKNAGVLPPELEMRKEVHNIAELINACADNEERARHLRRLEALITRINIGRKVPIQLECEYYEEIMQRVAGRNSEK